MSLEPTFLFTHCPNTLFCLLTKWSLTPLFSLILEPYQSGFHLEHSSQCYTCQDHQWLHVYKFEAYLSSYVTHLHL